MILVIPDLHLGKREEGEQILFESLSYLLRLYNPTGVIVLGDVLDRWTKVREFKGLARLLTLLYNYPAIIVKGNHDPLDLSFFKEIERNTEGNVLFITEPVTAHELQGKIKGKMKQLFEELLMSFDTVIFLPHTARQYAKHTEEEKKQIEKYISYSTPHSITFAHLFVDVLPELFSQERFPTPQGVFVGGHLHTSFIVPPRKVYYPGSFFPLSYADIAAHRYRNTVKYLTITEGKVQYHQLHTPFVLARRYFRVSDIKQQYLSLYDEVLRKVSEPFKQHFEKHFKVVTDYVIADDEEEYTISSIYQMLGESIQHIPVSLQIEQGFMSSVALSTTEAQVQKQQITDTEKTKPYVTFEEILSRYLQQEKDEEIQGYAKDIAASMKIL